jgi:hypothetical protein
MMNGKSQLIQGLYWSHIQEIAHLDNSMMKILVTNEVHIGKFAV